MLLATTILAASLCAKAPAIIDEVVAARDAGTAQTTLMFKVRNSDNSPSVKFWLNQTIITMYQPINAPDSSKTAYILLSCDNKEIRNEHQHSPEGRERRTGLGDRTEFDR